MRPIRREEISSAVADLQVRLGKLGFSIDAAELGGHFGPSTEAAVKELQQRRGLDVDGIVGEATWKELVESSWVLGQRLLQLTRPYLRGDDVADLQMRLNALGFNAGKHDGIFGPQSQQALREFQKNLAIDEDGICGQSTIAAFDRLKLVTRTGLGPRIIEAEARRSVPPGLGGKRIALDPGHGGEDHGEFVPGGATEADLCFRLAATASKLFDAAGARTVLTRGPKDGPSESERASVANEFAADLLISIHLNAHSNPQVRGAATYYFEHRGVASEPGEHLAGLIQESLAGLGLVDLRSHGKAYPILRESTMPAVVVEPGFATNSQDASALADRRSADSIAGALVQATRAYFSEG